MTCLEKLNELENTENVKQYFYQHFLEVEGLSKTEKKEISDKEFQSIFETYTNKAIKFPKLLIKSI